MSNCCVSAGIEGGLVEGNPDQDRRSAETPRLRLHSDGSRVAGGGFSRPQVTFQLWDKYLQRIFPQMSLFTSDVWSVTTLIRTGQHHDVRGLHERRINRFHISREGREREKSWRATGSLSMVGCFLAAGRDKELKADSDRVTLKLTRVLQSK